MKIGYFISFFHFLSHFVGRKARSKFLQTGVSIVYTLNRRQIKIWFFLKLKLLPSNFNQFYWHSEKGLERKISVLIDNVNWPPYLTWRFERLPFVRAKRLSIWERVRKQNFSCNLVLSAQLIKLNYPVILSHRRSTTVSIKSNPYSEVQLVFRGRD